MNIGAKADISLKRLQRIEILTENNAGQAHLSGIVTLLFRKR